MAYQYDNKHYDPPAPVLPIIMHIPGDSTKQMKIEALMDTGADMTCIQKALIKSLGGERAGSYNVQGVNKISIGSSYSYFLEFEIAAKSKIVEVIELGNEPILGRNLINKFKFQLDGPNYEMEIL